MKQNKRKCAISVRSSSGIPLQQQQQKINKKTRNLLICGTTSARLPRFVIVEVLRQCVTQSLAPLCVTETKENI